MSRVASRVLVAGAVALVATSSISLRAPAATLAAAPTELFFSEVIEGSSNNKALEIYNGTGAAIDLAAGGYNVQMFFNGNVTAALTINLTGTSLASGDVYVVAQSSASAAILAEADQTSSAGWFNGDDAVVLRKGTTIIDSLGQVGLDPGTEWGSGLTSTADNTLRRMPTVCAGDSAATDAFDPAVEWIGFATDTFDGLGSHAASCGGVSLTIDNVSASEGNSGTTFFDFTVSLTAPAGPGGVTFDIATADGTATTADSDYVANALTSQSIPEGSSSYAFSVIVNGDTTFEGDESFVVDVTNVSGADLADGQGLGTIVDDDACQQSFTPIFDIQGSGMSAAITGNVTTQGVVVGDFEGPTSAGLQGFYLQDGTGDGDAMTSDGIFVFTANNDNGLAAGDIVRVTGYARERFNQTTINGSNSNSSPVTAIVRCGETGIVSPADVMLPFEISAADSLERFEGMLVRFPQDLVIAEYFNYDRFGEMVLALPLDGETRPFTGTAIDEPGAPALARAAANALSRITLDDGLGNQNPSITRHPNGDPFSLTNTFRGGDTVTNTVGVLGFDFSLYRIQPTAPADYEATNPRPGEPEEVGGDVTVASMNTLNYFLTLDYPTGDPLDNTCGASQTLECRGADSNQPTEFTRQRDKLLAAIAGLDADVIGLNELENTPGVDPADDIAAGLNGIPGGETYAAIDTGVIGADAIRVGLIYRPDAVTPIGSFEVLDSTVDPRFDDTRSRPALAQTFEENATGERFTVIVNHLKSKGSSCADIGDPDIGDGQANCNLTRLAAAQALVDWAATDPTGSGDPDFLIIGDLNSYAREDPIDAVKAGADDTAGTADDWTNLIETFLGTFAYSFVFDGQAGYLDHALSNASLTGQVTGAAEWHINADEPDLIDYDTSFKSATQDTFYEPNAFRSSDHDPVLVGLDLNAPPTIDVAGGGTCGPAAGGTVLVTVGDLQTAAGDLDFAVVGTSNPGLVPLGNVVLGGAGADRTISISATPKMSGTAIIGFTLEDDVNTTAFTLTVTVGTGDPDTLSGTAGPDLILGLQGDDTLSGMGDGDLLCGGNGNDTLIGGDGTDTLEGERGDDVLTGGAGDDVLSGGLGNDALTGGTGADAFSGGFGVDLIVDLTPPDGDTWDGT